MKKTKVLSLVIVLILVLSMVFTACDNKPEGPQQSDEPTKSPDIVAEDVDKPVNLDITTLYYYGDPTENLAEKAAFEQHINDHYGINFRIHAPARDTYIETINLQAVTGDLTGMVRMFSGTDAIQWYQEGLVLGLDQYLTNNEVWVDIVPEHWKETFSYDGVVYGLAYGGDGVPQWFLRTMRGDWLDAVGMEKPQTIDEFYEVSKAFTLNDPNRSGANDTWGFCSRNIWLMQDLFKAFGTTPNWEADLVPVWNPREDIWEDPVVKPAMADAVTFLRKCYTEGIVHPELFTMSAADVRNLMSNGLAGSCFYWDHWLITWEDAVKRVIGSEAYMVPIGALTGLVKEKINPWKAEIGAPYVMMSNTEQPKEVINWFINLLYGSAEDFFTFRYGVPQASKDGKTGYYLDGKSLYQLHYQADAEGNVKSKGTPVISGGHPGYALDIGEYGYQSAFNSGNSEWDTQQINVVKGNLERRMDVFNEYNDGRLYVLTGEFEQPTNEEYTQVIGEWASAGMRYVTDVMVDGAAPQDALRAYLNTVMAFSPQITLDFMNAKLGKASTQDYAQIWNSIN